MKNAIAKALADLDGLSDKAVRVRILGLKAEPSDDMEEPSEENEMPSAENEMPEGEHPIAETVEKAVAEAVGEERNEPEDDAELVNPELLEKLKALLAK